MRMLIAGGAGFIGSNFVHHVLQQRPDYGVLVVDKLTYAGNLNNLNAAFTHPRFSFLRLDICAPVINDVVRGCDLVVNFAAESHVDRSIDNAKDFVRSNIEGSWRLLEACRRPGAFRQFPRKYAAVTEQSVLGDQGRGRPDGPGLRKDLRFPGHRDAVLKQLRTVAVSGEVYTADDHASARRRLSSGLW